MEFTLPPLPFELDALEPCISQKTVEFHYGKHHKTYVKTLNDLIRGTDYASKSLEEIIRTSHGLDAKIFNNAAQTWNHTFLWNCLTGEKASPSQALEAHIAESFHSMTDFVNAFNTQCKNLFGSGWVWLVADSHGRLGIKSYGNAGTPLIDGDVPLFTCDVWEHAYYLDYQNERMKYVENFWGIVNWPFVEANLEQAPKGSSNGQM